MEQFEIKVENLSLNLGGNSILEDINFKVLRGEAVCLIGPNGSGKTSLLRSLLGFYNLTGLSTVSFFGMKFHEREEYIKENIIFVADEDKVSLDLTGYEFIHFIASFYPVEMHNRNRQEALIDLFDMRGELDRPLLSYSHGMTKKIQFIAYLSINSKVIILDEPFNGLDAEYTQLLFKILEELKNKGKTIIISSHNLSLIERISDKIVVLIDGKLTFFDTTQNLLGLSNKPSIEAGWLEIIGIKGKKDEEIKKFIQYI